ncbi:hypothetical protein RI054_09g45860 [Pseudoscourfieldia marina]
MVSLPMLRMLISLLGQGVFKHSACFDIGNAFASTPAQRRCVISQPTGYWDGTTDALLLLRVLYGQSDAGRSFWLHLEQTLLLEYQRSDSDPCIFFRGNLADGNLVVIATHVDDGPVFAQRQVDIDDLTALLRKHFDRVKLELQPKQLLGMQLEYKPDGVRVHQTNYSLMLAEKFKRVIDEQRAVHTPSTESAAANTTPLTKQQMTEYRSKVGCLLYLACGTRPDIAHAVNCVARKMHQADLADDTACNRILKYVSQTSQFGLWYGNDNDATSIRLVAYVDSDWAGEPDRRSLGGLALRINRQALVHWRVMKQKVVAKSSAEAELIALADHSDMVMTARLLLAELGLGQDRTPVHEDNSAAIQILGDRRYDGRTKHVDYRIKSVRERVLSGAINVTYISTKLQLADMFTKGLPRVDHERMTAVALHGGDLDSLS